MSCPVSLLDGSGTAYRMIRVPMWCQMSLLGICAGLCYCIVHFYHDIHAVASVCTLSSNLKFEIRGVLTRDSWLWLYLKCHYCTLTTMGQFRMSLSWGFVHYCIL